MKGSHDVDSVKMQRLKMHSLEITPRKFGTGNLLGREGKKLMGFHIMGSQAGEVHQPNRSNFPKVGKNLPGTYRHHEAGSWNMKSG